MGNTRRSFLTGITGAAGLTYLRSAAASTAQLKPLLATVPQSSESYWKLVGEQFPLRAGKIPMNAANLCPAPRVVSERVAELTRDEDSDISNQNRAKFHDLQEESRQKVAEHLGVSPEEIALVRNTSEANNIVNNGINLKSGDEIVIWDQNHPCNNVAWDVRAARFGYAIKRVTVPNTVKSTDEIVKLFEAAITPRTRMLSITYISNTTGMRLPAKELASLARQRGIYCHLDGAQAWGFLKMDLKDIGCDSLGASAHKWLMGPKQAGILYVRAQRIPEIWPSIVTAGWGNGVDTAAKGARKFEVMGQRDDGCLAAVGTAVDFQRAIGYANIEARTMELAAALKAGLWKINKLKPVTPADPKLSGGVVISALSDADSPKMRTLISGLYDKYGIAAVATGGLRLSPHTYNTMDDIELAVRGVRELLA